MTITTSSIIECLKTERDTAQKGVPFKVINSRRQGAFTVMALEPSRDGGRRVTLDEALEGSKAAWYGDKAGRGEVVVVDPQKGEISLRFVQGSLPDEKATILLYQHDFLSPLLDLWQDKFFKKRAASVLKGVDKPAVADTRELGNLFGVLRASQIDAVSLPLNRISLLHGPPGTGKTFTIGAMVANLLTRFKNSKILITGPTNTAVDEALLSTDNWLERLNQHDLRKSMKRVGSRFDGRKYRDREHLLAKGIYEASLEVTMLELDEPSKDNVEKYVVWKNRIDAARAKLKSDVTQTAITSRVVAITTTSLFLHYPNLSRPGGTPWHFVISDEASQIPLPAALMVASIGNCCTFAGDPKQLAPIVQSNDPSVSAVLSKTAFDVLKKAPSVFLNEQSRMCAGVCDVISNTFYEDKLIVCKKSCRDTGWKKARSPWYINGRELPRVLVDDRAGTATWSQKYNGKIRFQSAQLVAAYVNELLGSYVDIDDILVLTPFRAQRALIRMILAQGEGKSVRVNTVHRAQGSERRIVIFDPVDAGSPFLNSETGRRLINVAASRAQAHLIILAGPEDMSNPYIENISKRASHLWDLRGDYATPVRTKLQVGQ